MSTLRHSPECVCSGCGRQAWRLVFSKTDDNAVQYRRVRVYHCAHCTMRLFTHEEETEEPFSTQAPLRCLKMDLNEHPCHCGHAQFIRCAYPSPHMRPLVYYRYVCQRCGRQMDTEEREAGQTAEITPRNRRGKTPHPLRRA